jgi:putative addiction module CopG family antidote
MTVSVPSSLEAFVRRKIAAGDFASADDVVGEALRLLERQEAWKADARQKIDLGWNQARTGQLSTPEEVRNNLASRKESWRRSQKK